MKRNAANVWVAGSVWMAVASAGWAWEWPAVTAVPGAGTQIEILTMDVSPVYAPSADDRYPPEIEDAKDAVKWQTGVALPNGTLDFYRLLGPHENAVAYARVVLQAAADCKIRLSLGSDGLLVIVNGKRVFSHPTGTPPGTHQVEVALVRGANTLLFRVANGGRGWLLTMKAGLLSNTTRVVQDTAAAAPPILDANAYWRMWYTYSPARIAPDKLKAEGEKWMGAQKFQRLQQITVARNTQDGHPIADWMQDAVSSTEVAGLFSFMQLSIMVGERLRTAAPPRDWMKPDFDDSDWPRQKVLYAPASRCNIRARFEVPEPSQVKDMTLEMVFRGGAIVYLNGREIGRGHMAPGELADSATAEEYPVEAYLRQDGEYSAFMFTLTDERLDKKRNGLVLAPELPASLADLGPFPATALEARIPVPDAAGLCFLPGTSTGISTGGYQRIVGLRDRTLTIAIRPDMLCKGANVLAVETRGALLHPVAALWNEPYRAHYGWSHSQIRRIQLRAREHGIASPMVRPPVNQVWAEDIHRRVYTPDFCELSHPNPSLRIVAARNGTFGAQLAVGTAEGLGGLKVAVSDLKGEGAQLSATTIRAMYPVPHLISELHVGDVGRRIGNSPNFEMYPQYVARRYGAGDIPFYEHLSTLPPPTIPPGTTYTVWLSLSVPDNTVAGTYRGTVTVSGDKLPAVLMPLTVEVADWRIPKPADWTLLMGLEESAYSVATQYKVAPWSDAHFKLLESVFAQLARVNNTWLNVSVLANGQFGNRLDSPLRIVRRRDGKLELDFRNVDRYIALATKFCGKPRVLNFSVLHPGNPGDNRFNLSTSDVPVHDEASGKIELMAVDARMAAGPRREFWKFLADGIYGHLKALGLEQSLYWGYTWDGPGADPSLYELLAEFQPTVFWTKGSHSAPPNKYVRMPATAYNSELSAWFTSKKGWKRPTPWLAYPRYWGTIIDCSDYSPPFCFRMLPERAVASGASGIGRVGADYWGKTLLDGHVCTYDVGVPNLFLLWPGEQGAETGIRYELFVEGLQETEARIFLEKAMEKLSPETHGDLLKRLQALLDERLVETLIDSPASSYPELADLCSKGWQNRSRRLYQAAAEVAKIAGQGETATPKP